MSAEDGPEQEYIDNYSNDSPIDQKSSSPKNMFEDEDREDRNGINNRQPNYRTPFIPSVAVPEKIVLCIDTSQDMSLGYTCSPSNTTETKSTVLNEALRVFFVNKLAIAKDTEFALVSIKPGKIELISRFTSDVNHLVRSLSDMKAGSNEEALSDYNVTQMFNFLSEIDGPEYQKSKVVPPEFVVRVVFVYNNSYTIPKLNENDKFYKDFLNSPNFVLDIVHMHEAQTDSNNVVRIYEQLSKIISPRSYLFECSRDVTLVFNTFAKLLAHPYQRVSQGLWDF